MGLVVRESSLLGVNVFAIECIWKVSYVDIFVVKHGKLSFFPYLSAPKTASSSFLCHVLLTDIVGGIIRIIHI